MPDLPLEPGMSHALFQLRERGKTQAVSALASRKMGAVHEALRKDAATTSGRQAEAHRKHRRTSPGRHKALSRQTI